MSSAALRSGAVWAGSELTHTHTHTLTRCAHHYFSPWFTRILQSPPPVTCIHSVLRKALPCPDTDSTICDGRLCSRRTKYYWMLGLALRLPRKPRLCRFSIAVKCNSFKQRLGSSEALSQLPFQSQSRPSYPLTRGVNLSSWGLAEGEGRQGPVKLTTIEIIIITQLLAGQSTSHDFHFIA